MPVFSCAATVCARITSDKLCVMYAKTALMEIRSGKIFGRTKKSQYVTDYCVTLVKHIIRDNSFDHLPPGAGKNLEWFFSALFIFSCFRAVA